jgi:hypothetical protein
VKKCSALHHAITKTGQRSVERYFRAKVYDRVLPTVSIINATRIRWISDPSRAVQYELVATGSGGNVNGGNKAAISCAAHGYGLTLPSCEVSGNGCFLRSSSV